MSKRIRRYSALVLLAAGLLTVPLRAEGPASPDVQGDEKKLARLEALLEAQQNKIEALEQQVANAQQADMNAARVDQMKQQIREVLSEQEFRESLMPSTVQAGYDNGFFIKSSDEKFLMRFNGQLQFRYTYYATRNENRYLSPGLRRHDRSGFDIARMNFDISGHAYTKDLTYFFEISAPSGTDLDAVLSYAWINYRIMDEFQIKAGLFRVASTRANFGSNAKYQFVEAPTMDAVFGLNDGLGVQLWGQLFDKSVEYWLQVVNTLDRPAANTITTDETQFGRGHDNNPAIVARMVWHALHGASSNPAVATDKPSRFDSLCDMEHSTEPALDFGMHYAFNEDYRDNSLRIPFPRRTFFRDGGFGLVGSQGLQIQQMGVDAAFKYMGFSITGEYVIRILDVRSADSWRYTPLFLATGDDSTNAQHGGYVQAGYFLPIPGWENKLEVVGRVGGVSALSGGHEGTWDYGGGFNYYIQGHNVKIQTDVTKVSENPISNSQYSLANVNDDALIWRVQLQVAF